MALHEIQHKYYNNKIVEDGRIKGTIKMQDCLADGEVYYVLTVPKGAIIKGVTAYLTNCMSVTDTATIRTQIGDNNCVFCDEAPEIVINTTKAVCDESCKCMIVDKDYLMKVTVIAAPTDSDIEILVDIMRPRNVQCAVKPLKLCTADIILPYCDTVTDCNDCGCE